VAQARERGGTAEPTGGPSRRINGRQDLSRLAPDEIERLTRALRAHEHLQRILGEIEELQRIVFYANARADWSLARRSAEQILIAEIVYRHKGDPEGVRRALRVAEHSGQTWDAALRELAAAVHSYYTTPLGMVMRQGLFGRDTVFITPDAHEWTAQQEGKKHSTDGKTL
jgi:hypothetical protein